MTIDDLQGLEVGDRVEYVERLGMVAGRVTGRGYSGLTITWDDGIRSTFRFRTFDARVDQLRLVRVSGGES